MTPLFARGPSLQIRLLLLGMLSTSLIYLDQQVEEFAAVRASLLAMISPIHYAAQAPSDVLNFTTRNLMPRQLILDENQRLKDQLLLQNEQLQQVAALKTENNQLRALLGTDKRQQSRRMVSEVMALKQDPFSKQLVIDKGSLHGVFEGQAVLDQHGVVGQVMHVGPSSSNVLLVADRQHGIPVRMLRNNVGTVANGSGTLDELLINHVPFSVDIKVGDVLVTSGLGGRFPAGYPVAEISHYETEEGQAFASIRARPLARLDRLRYVVLLWPGEGSAAEFAADTVASAGTDTDSNATSDE